MIKINADYTYAHKSNPKQMWFSISKLINIIHYISKQEKQNEIQKREKAVDKIQNLFWIKALERLGIQGTHLKSIKAIYGRLTTNTNLNGDKLKGFPLKLKTRQGRPLILIPLQYITEAVRQLKEKRDIQIERGKLKYLYLQTIWMNT